MIRPPVLHKCLLRIVLPAVRAAILDFAAEMMVSRRFDMLRPILTAGMLAAIAWVLALVLKQKFICVEHRCTDSRQDVVNEYSIKL